MVGATHRVREIFGFGAEVVEVVEVVMPVEVVEVVDVGEVVVLRSSSWRTLAFRASGSSGFHDGRSTRAPVVVLGVVEDLVVMPLTVVAEA